MALVGNLGTLGNEALATLLATAAKNVAPRLRGHASPEAVLVLAGTLRGLVSPFHLFRSLEGYPGERRSQRGYSAMARILRLGVGTNPEPAKNAEGGKNTTGLGKVNAQIRLSAGSKAIA